MDFEALLACGQIMNGHVVIYLAEEIAEVRYLCMCLEAETDLPFDYIEGYEDQLDELIETYKQEIGA